MLPDMGVKNTPTISCHGHVQKYSACLPLGNEVISFTLKMASIQESACLLFLFVMLQSGQVKICPLARPDLKIHIWEPPNWMIFQFKVSNVTSSALLHLFDAPHHGPEMNTSVKTTLTFQFTHISLRNSH